MERQQDVIRDLREQQQVSEHRLVEVRAFSTSESAQGNAQLHSQLARAEAETEMVLLKGGREVDDVRSELKTQEAAAAERNLQLEDELHRLQVSSEREMRLLRNQLKAEEVTASTVCATALSSSKAMESLRERHAAAEQALSSTQEQLQSETNTATKALAAACKLAQSREDLLRAESAGEYGNSLSGQSFAGEQRAAASFEFLDDAMITATAPRRTELHEGTVAELRRVRSEVETLHVRLCASEVECQQARQQAEHVTQELQKSKAVLRPAERGFREALADQSKALAERSQELLREQARHLREDGDRSSGPERLLASR